MQVAHIEQWIHKGTYLCPGCQFRMAGPAWSAAKYEHDCPRCGKYPVRNFKRAHK